MSLTKKEIKKKIHVKLYCVTFDQTPIVVCSIGTPLIEIMASRYTITDPHYTTMARGIANYIPVASVDSDD